MKQKTRKKQQTEQKNMEKEISVRKPLILYFLIVCLIIGVVALLLSAICYGVVNLWADADRIYIEHIEHLQSKDVAIVPGAPVYSNAPGVRAKDRLDAAISLYEKGLVESIFVSGDTDEVSVMLAYLVINGIPSEDLKGDSYGFDTYETLARFCEGYEGSSAYICTQDIYGHRASYLMKQMDVEGQVIRVDTMQYNNMWKSYVREYFAATKAVMDGMLRDGTPKHSIAENAFSEAKEPEENHDHVKAEDVELPEDSKTIDTNPKDGYDVEKAVEYARNYVYERNLEYPVYEQNCANYVSQCLVAGGIEMRGENTISERKRWKNTDDSDDWYCYSEMVEKHGHKHYSSTRNFVNTDEFIQYFTEQRGYRLTVYDNSYNGKMDYYNNVSCGDIYILYNAEGTIDHIGLITGVGDMNVYYCANTSDKKDYSAFNISDISYPQIGILHMSE